MSKFISRLMAEVADEQRNDLAEWQAFGRVVDGTNVEKP